MESFRIWYVLLVFPFFTAIGCGPIGHAPDMAMDGSGPQKDPSTEFVALIPTLSHDPQLQPQENPPGQVESKNGEVDSETSGITKIGSPRIFKEKTNSELTMQVPVVNGGQNEVIVLQGQINPENSASLIEPDKTDSDLHRLKAIVQCWESSCRNLIADIYFKHKGKIKKTQFNLIQPIPEELNEGEVVVEEIWDNEHDEQFYKEIEEAATVGEFVSKRPDRLFLEGLENQSNDLVTESKVTEVEVDDHQAETGKTHSNWPEAENNVSSPKEKQGIEGEEVPAPTAATVPATSGKESGSVIKELFGELDLKGGGHAVRMYVNGKEQGRIINSSALILDDPFKAFKVQDPSNKKYFGSGLMIDLIETASRLFKLYFYKDSKVLVSNISKEGGGRLAYRDHNGGVRFHRSHQSGLDADIAYLRAEPGFVQVASASGMHSGFDFQRNFDFFKLLVDTGWVQAILVNYSIKKAFCDWGQASGRIYSNKDVFSSLRGVSKHTDHFHLRLKCSPEYKVCQNRSLDPQPCPVARGRSI